jgi:two-component system sensor histidine kinase CiaH
MFRSATVRLTLWYLAIAMGISLLFSVALFNVTTGELRSGLHKESQSIYNQFPVFQGDPNVNIRPDSYYHTASHVILLRLVAFNLIVLIGAGISSYLLAKRTLDPIEAAHKQQKRFTSDVSHELRTPLTAIKMESEVALLAKDLPISELRQTLESNVEEVNKLETLINNLLRLSRLEADELQQNFVTITSADVVKHAIDKVGKMAESHDIKLVSEGSSADFHGDLESLSQLLTILIDNSIKYSSPKTTIRIEYTNDKDNVIWQIKDEGVGIKADALSHIFDRFYRAESSRNKNGHEGYGLGLSIAKMIADVHNGDVTLNSQPGKGTTAIVSIPKKQ